MMGRGQWELELLRAAGSGETCTGNGGQWASGHDNSLGGDVYVYASGRAVTNTFTSPPNY